MFSTWTFFFPCQWPFAVRCLCVTPPQLFTKVLCASYVDIKYGVKLEVPGVPDTEWRWVACSALLRLLATPAVQLPPIAESNSWFAQPWHFVTIRPCCMYMHTCTCRCCSHRCLVISMCIPHNLGSRDYLQWTFISLCCRYITEEDGVVILRKYNAATRINWLVQLLLQNAATLLAPLCTAWSMYTTPDLVVQPLLKRDR